MILDEVAARLRGAGCVFAEEEAAVLIESAPDDAGQLARLVSARVAGEPLEQLVGWVSFAGRRLAVGPGVFVPRVRTELLAETALSKITGSKITGSDATGIQANGAKANGAVVVELCCGVAAVAAVLQRSGQVAELYAADIDPTAVGYARRNLSEPAVLLVGDLFNPLPATLCGRVDLIVANAPYVPTEAISLMPREARDHEPAVALDGGPDGADVHRKIITEAPSWLRGGGWLVIETGREQSVITAGEMRRAGFSTGVVIDDERDATVVVGTLTAT